MRWAATRCQHLAALARNIRVGLPPQGWLAPTQQQRAATAAACVELNCAARALARALSSARRPAPLAPALDPTVATAWKAVLHLVARLGRQAAASPTRQRLGWCQGVAGDITEAARALADDYGTEERSKKAAQWKAWVHEAVQGGAGAAHRCAKPLEALRVASVADADGTPTACRAALLAADHAKWAAVWGASAAPPRSRCEANQQGSPEDQGDIAVQRWLDAAPTQQLPPLTVEEVRAAAQGFKPRTSTPDGWHPRHIALLPLPFSKNAVRAQLRTRRWGACGRQATRARLRRRLLLLAFGGN
jgi:hypothetical protein